MTSGPVTPDPGQWRIHTANDAFKAEWRGRLHRCVGVAVLLHALLFLGSPTWDRSEIDLERSGDGAQIEVLALASLPAGGGGPPPIVGSIPDPEPEPQEEADGEDTEGSDSGDEGLGEVEGDFPTLEEALREGFGDRPAPTPEIVEPEPVTEREDASVLDESSGSEAGESRAGRDATLPDLEALTDEEAMDLSRLSALRPELAFHSPSSWILVRNPAEVGAFLQRNFRGGELDEGPGGTVSISVWIDERGSVEWAEINRSSGVPQVDDAALRLFTDIATFRPAREQGIRVPMAVIFWLSYPW